MRKNIILLKNVIFILCACCGGFSLVFRRKAALILDGGPLETCRQSGQDFASPPASGFSLRSRAVSRPHLVSVNLLWAKG